MHNEVFEEPASGEGEGDRQEFYDSPQTLDKKVTLLADLIKESKHCVFHTGAGISTACSLPDFRGPTGVWTLKEKGIGTDFNKDLADICPSLTHMTIASLMESGFCKYLVSQNVDGLHLRSGIPASKLSELHGNSFVESCLRCGTTYMRDFDVGANGGKEIPDSVLSKMSFQEIAHLTGRVCKNGQCIGFLHDSIINFGENLPEEALGLATKHSKKSDLSIVMGSSLTVKPACTLPTQSNKIVIINLQHTPLDDHPKVVLRIFAKCDDVMRLLCDKLQIEVSEWIPPPPSEMRLFYLEEQKKYEKSLAEIRERSQKRAEELKQQKQQEQEQQEQEEEKVTEEVKEGDEDQGICTIC